MFQFLSQASALNKVDIFVAPNTVAANSEQFVTIREASITCVVMNNWEDVTDGMLPLIRAMPGLTSLSIKSVRMATLSNELGQPVLLPNLVSFEKERIFAGKHEQNDWSRIVAPDSCAHVSDMTTDSTQFFESSPTITQVLSRGLHKLSITDEGPCSGGVFPSLRQLTSLFSLRMIVARVHSIQIDDVVRELDQLPSSVETVECTAAPDWMVECFSEGNHESISDLIPRMELAPDSSLRCIEISDFGGFDIKDYRYLLHGWYQPLKRQLGALGVELVW